MTLTTAPHTTDADRDAVQRARQANQDAARREYARSMIARRDPTPQHDADLATARHAHRDTLAALEAAEAAAAAHGVTA